MSFIWGGQSWNPEDLEAFKRYLASRGTTYSAWAANHPSAASTFNTGSTANVGSGFDDAKAARAEATGTAPVGAPPAGTPAADVTTGGGRVTPVDQPPPDDAQAGSGFDAAKAARADATAPAGGGAATGGGATGGGGGGGGVNPVPQPPPDDNLGGGYDAAKAARASGVAATGSGPVPSYPEPGTGGLGQAGPYDPSTAGTPPTTSVLGQIGTIDWSSILGIYGMDNDVVREINRIFTITGGNLQQAIPIAQAYIRSTEWYGRNYPSIQSGINAGLFEDERGYRTYQNQISQIYAQYYGRPATPTEAALYMSSGQSIQQVSAHFQANALSGTISDPLKALFTPDELQAYVNEQAGIDTALGQTISQQADMAMKVQQLYQEFYGRNVTRSELDTLVSGGLTAEAVARNFATISNINGMNPAVRDLFSQTEIRDIALTMAGGTSPNGTLLQQKAQLAAALNAGYHTFTGQGVTRQEVEDAWSQGLTAQEVSARLEATQRQGALPSFLRDIFDEGTLRSAAGAVAGSDMSAGALRNQQIVQGAGAYQQVVRQYENRNVTAQELNGWYDQNLSADTLAKQFQGQGIVGAKGEGYQNVLGSFGGGQLEGGDMTTLGQQQAGIDTILGQQLQERLAKAQKRVAGAFNSAVSKPSLSFAGGKLTTGRGKPSDVGA